MRASYDSLFSRVKEVLEKDPFSGHLFLFINAKRTTVKCLYYDGTGFVIISKRLEQGTFSQMNPFYKNEIVLTEAEFGLFFEGADLRKRFIDSPRERKRVSTTNQHLNSAVN
jgi:transposase